MIIVQSGLPNAYNGFTAGAWKASRFPGNTSQNRFPTIGQSIPASPDVTGAVAANAYSITTPTDEVYHVAIYDGSNKVVFHFLQDYRPPTYIARQDFSGPGAPPAAFKPPDGSTWASSTSQAPGSRFYIIWAGVWTATAA